MSRLSRPKPGCGSCAAGCGVVAIALVTGCVAFNVWIHAPGQLFEPTAVFDPEASGFAECRLDLADPPTRAAFDAIAAELRRKRSLEGIEEVPKPLRWLVEVSQGKQERDLERLFPMTLAWVAGAGADPPGDHLLVFSAARLSRQAWLADLVLRHLVPRLAKAPLHAYPGESIYRFGSAESATAHAFSRHGGIFVTTGLEAARAAVERLGEPRPPRSDGATAIEQLLASLPPGAPLRGAIVPRPGELQGWIGGWLASDPASLRDLSEDLDPIRSIVVEGRFEEAGEAVISLQAVLEPPSEGAARRLDSALRAKLAEAPDGLRVESRPSPSELLLTLYLSPARLIGDGVFREHGGWRVEALPTR